MTTRIFVCIIIFFVGLAVFFFLNNTATITNYPPKNEKIVAFGDSLVFGQGAGEGNDFVSVLEKKLGKDIVNLGVSGNTTADGLRRIEEVLDEDSGIVIVLLGGNDGLRRISKETTRANLKAIVEKCIEQGSVVVLLGVRGGLIVDEREEIYREVSDEYGAVYVEDVLDGIFLKPELMSDGIHPNDAGYAIIAERLYKIFIKNKL